MPSLTNACCHKWTARSLRRGYHADIHQEGCMPTIRGLLGALALFVVSLPLFAADTPPRNWGRCPAVVSLDTEETFYALGDTHGDYNRLVDLLVAGKLIENAPASPE